MCTQGFVTINPHLNMNFVGAVAQNSLVCLGTGGRQVNPLPISKSHRLPDPSPQGSVEAEPENEGSRMSDGS